MSLPQPIQSTPPAAQPAQQEPINVAQAYAMAQVCLDLHDALGCKWGDNPYLAIDRLKTAAPVPLTDEQIQDVLTEAVRAGEVSWLGYKLDADGFYTIPSLSPQHYKIFRAAEKAHGITAIKQTQTAPTVQEPVAVTYKEVADTMNALWGGTLAQVQIAMEMANRKLYTTPPAQPVVPDAMTSADIQEHIEYVAGWNDCRQAMLEMMKARTV
jgi:hypothetical protein